VPETLSELLATSRALWGGEATVFRAYWRAPTRSADTDRAWLARQCHKEIFDGVMPRLTVFEQRLADGAEIPGRNADPLDGALVEAVEEYRHFRLFADVYDALREPGDPALDFATLRDHWRWPENDALGELRARHRRDHGALGALAGVFTEGGGATLYAEGMALTGASTADRLIADACRAVHDEEVAHMKEGLDGLRARALDPADWVTLHTITVEQLRQRIVMRNAQFGHPLTPAEVANAQRGDATPAGATIADD
jgi:hypothetical protein